ncbi:hypothetical protein RYX36_005194 [Vicia faba]
MLPKLDNSKTCPKLLTETRRTCCFLIIQSMAAQSSSSSKSQVSKNVSHDRFFVWREFVWGAVAGAFREGMMHPMVRSVWKVDGLKGYYRGVLPGVTGSLATGATYFGVIESTKKWIEDSHPSLEGH